MAQIGTVGKNSLMLIAGIVWALAGGFVTSVGIPPLAALGPTQWWLFPLAVVVFLVFYWFIFRKLVKKHTGRVRRMGPRAPFWQFFDAKSYAIMAVMMGGGMWLRLSHVAPDWFFAFFYTGLGIALFACGVRFLSVWAHRRVHA